MTMPYLRKLYDAQNMICPAYRVAVATKVIGCFQCNVSPWKIIWNKRMMTFTVYDQTGTAVTVPASNHRELREKQMEMFRRGYTAYQIPPEHAGKYITIHRLIRREKAGDGVPHIDMYEEWREFASGNYGIHRSAHLYVDNDRERQQLEWQSGVRIEDMPLYDSDTPINYAGTRQYPSPYEVKCVPFVMLRVFNGLNEKNEPKWRYQFAQWVNGQVAAPPPAPGEPPRLNQQQQPPPPPPPVAPPAGTPPSPESPKVAIARAIMTHTGITKEKLMAALGCSHPDQFEGTAIQMAGRALAATQTTPQGAHLAATGLAEAIGLRRYNQEISNEAQRILNSRKA